MKTNGESIHGTTASLFPKVSWSGRSTTRSDPKGHTRVYLHVFSRPEGGKLAVTGIQSRPDGAVILGKPGTKLPVTGQAGEWIIQLPESPLDPLATVVALDFPGKVSAGAPR
jgi:hypothetical protein